MQPEMVPVGSSLIKEVGYDEENKEMWARLYGGCIYIYSDVPQGVYDKLLNCQSVGRFFAKTIRPNFSCRRADEGEVC